MNTDERKKANPSRRSHNSQHRRKQPPVSRSGRRGQVSAPKKRKNAPEVTYTPAKPFNRSRFLLQLVTVAAVVIAVMFGISIFFKVKHITVTGAERYSAWTVREASGILEGENLMTFGKTKACGRIKVSLPYVDEVRIGIKLPDTVNIEIVELDVVYAIEDTQNHWWLMTSDGVLVEQVNGANAASGTRIWGVKISDPVAGEKVRAAALFPETIPETTADESLPPEETDAQEPETTEAAVPELTQTPYSNEDRLEAVLEILKNLEQNEILGEIASVDVEDLSNVELWYGDRYQVLLGGTDRLAYKIECLKKAVDQMYDHQSGILDISFTIWTDKVGYSLFE